MTPLVAVLVSVGMLVVVPVGLRLVAGGGSPPRLPSARWWTAAAGPAAGAPRLPPGPPGGLRGTRYPLAAPRPAGCAAVYRLPRGRSRARRPGRRGRRIGRAGPGRRAQRRARYRRGVDAADRRPSRRGVAGQARPAHGARVTAGRGERP